MTYILAQSVIDTSPIIDGINAALSTSNILGLMFKGISLLVVGFYAYAIVNLYSKKMLGEEIRVKDMLRPFGILLLIIFWKWIYFDVLDNGFAAISGFIAQTLSQEAVTNNSSLTQEMNEAARQGTLNFMSISIEAVIFAVFQVVTVFLNAAVDSVVAVYVGLSDLVLGMVAPIALAFTLLEVTKGMFTMWLKIFFMYRVCFLLIVVENHLSILITNGVVSQFTGLVGQEFTAASGGSVLSGALLLGLFVGLIFKIVFIIVVFNIVQMLFGVQHSGVGAAVKSISEGAQKAGSVAMGKPPVG